MRAFIGIICCLLLSTSLAAAERVFTLTLADGSNPLTGVMCRVVSTASAATTDGSGSAVLAGGDASLDRAIAFVAAPTSPVLERFTIDGVVDFSQLHPVEQTSLTWLDALTLTPGDTTTLRWAWRNDDRWLYLAVEWTDDTNDKSWSLNGDLLIDQVKVRFDPANDGSFDNLDDSRYVFPALTGCQFRDEHKIGEDVIGDGDARVQYHAVDGVYQAEFLIPLGDDANGHDGVIVNGSRFDLVFFDALELTGGVVQSGAFTAISGDDTSSAGWGSVPVQAVSGLTHPQVPADLDGLICYLREKPNPNGDIFVFDPATGISTQVAPSDGGQLATFNALKKENVSLSNDLTRIAFHAYTPSDYSTAEIYILAVDGSSFTQLTSNSWLDGHPGWSLDDSQICYASYDPTYTGAHVMLRNSDGSGVVTDLTLASDPQVGTPGYYEEENDPDFLPDGRIIYKTNRYSPWAGPGDNELRIAVMDANGSNPTQLSYGTDLVDHDPVGDSTHAIFERLPKNLNYSTEPEALFTPWPIVMVPLDGSGTEQQLTTDDWINWLPVFDPSGQYVVYLKTSGYTDARLMTRSGAELGRLIPDVTAINYVDWKSGVLVNQ